MEEEFIVRIILEPWPKEPFFDLIMQIEADRSGQLFMCIDHRGAVEQGTATATSLDNDAIDGIMNLMKRAKEFINS